MNKVILMGRLTRDPEVRYSQGENATAIARFSLAVDRRFSRQGDSVTADFLDCTSFGKQAEFVEKYLKKGTKILFTGRIQNNNYTNANGDKVYALQLIAEEIEFAESKSSASANNTGMEMNTSMPQPSQAASDGFMNIPDGIDEELPFN